MTSSYTSPTNSNTDWIRDKIGDIDSAVFILTDEEIQAEITANSNLYLAAANCCFKCTTRLGEYGELADRFERRGNQLLKEARRHAGFTSTTPVVGVLTDAGTMPGEYHISDEKPADWSLNRDDLPNEVRGVDI
jgi:hypothetical protein